MLSLVRPTLLTLFVTGAALVGQIQRPPAGPLTPLPAPDARGAVRAAIAEGTLTVAGKAFPNIALANAKTQSCCKIGDVHSVDVAKIALHGPKNDKKGAPTPPAPVEAVYSPPGGCWVVQSYTRVTMSAAGAYQAWDDAQPAKFNYNTSTVYNQELSSLKNYVGSLNIPDYAEGGSQYQVGGVREELQLLRELHFNIEPAGSSPRADVWTRPVQREFLV